MGGRERVRNLRVVGEENRSKRFKPVNTHQANLTNFGGFMAIV
jgi:hypothetical protein